MKETLMNNYNFKLAIFWFSVVGMTIFYNLPFTTGVFRAINVEMIFFILIINSYLAERVAKNGGFTKENLFSVWN